MLTSSCFEQVTVEIEPLDLLAGNWELQGGTIYNPETGSSDLFSEIEPCSTDDVLRILSSGQYERNEGIVRCDFTESPIYDSGRFEVNGNLIIFASQQGQILVAQYAARVYTMTLSYQVEGVRFNFVYGRL